MHNRTEQSSLRLTRHCAVLKFGLEHIMATAWEVTYSRVRSTTSFSASSPLWLIEISKCRRRLSRDIDSATSCESGLESGCHQALASPIETPPSTIVQLKANCAIRDQRSIQSCTNRPLSRWPCLLSHNVVGIVDEICAEPSLLQTLTKAQAPRDPVDQSFVQAFSFPLYSVPADAYRCLCTDELYAKRGMERANGFFAVDAKRYFGVGDAQTAR